MIPNEVNSTNEKYLFDSVFNNLKIFGKPKFKVGNNVRIRKFKHVFEKGYTANWTTANFKLLLIQKHTVYKTIKVMV